MTSTSVHEPSSTNDPATEEAPIASDSWIKLAGRWVVQHAIFSMLLAFIVVFAVLNPVFGSIGNVEVILLAASGAALLAIGEAFVVLTGGIDLSVGSVVGLSGVVSALVAQQAPVPIAVLAGVGAGVAVGLINGTAVAVAKMPPFVVTLGMLTVAFGVAQVLSGGAPISGLPDGFVWIANGSLLGIPIPILVMAAVFAVAWVVAQRSKFGMNVYAVGGNPLAATIAGVKTRRVTTSVYCISGALAGLAGVMLASRVTAGIASTGTGYELDAIAAVVIGGISLVGGRGKITGALIGVLIIATLNNGLDILNVSAFYQNIIKGALIIFAVLVDVRVAKREA